MQQKTLAILFFAALVVVGIVYVLKPESEQTFDTQGALFSGLKENLSKVTQLTISVPGPELVADIKQQQGQWVLANKNGFVAEFEKVLQLLTDVSQATLLEAKTRKSEFYDRLGVDGIEALQSSTKLEIFLEGQSKPYQAYIGNALDNNAGQYVRLVDDEQSWLIDRTLVLYKATEDWLDRDIIDIDINRIKEIQFKTPDGKTVNAKKDSVEDENFTIANIPEGRELIYQSIGNSLANAIAGLRLQDVFTVQEKPFTEDDRIYTSTFVTFDGLLVDVKSVQRDDQYFTQLKLGYQGEPQTQEDSSIATVKQEVETLGARLNNWVFSISEPNYTSLTKTMDDLLKSVSSEEESSDNS